MSKPSRIATKSFAAHSLRDRCISRFDIPIDSAAARYKYSAISDPLACSSMSMTGILRPAHPELVRFRRPLLRTGDVLGSVGAVELEPGEELLRLLDEGGRAP